MVVMDANELRLGNSVLVNGRYSKVLWNDLEDCAGDLTPIVITNEDWQKIGQVDGVLCDVSGFVIFKNGYAYQFLYSDYKHWHDLENLYFALTNKELSIN